MNRELAERIRPHIEQKTLDQLKARTGLNQNTVLDLLLKGWTYVEVREEGQTTFEWKKGEN